MNIDAVEKYYNALMHLRIAKTYLAEIFECEYHIKNFNEDNAIIFLNNTILKYLIQIRLILSITNKDISVVDDTPGVYMTKSVSDEVADLITLRACLVIIASSKLGMGSIEEIANRCI